MLTPRQRNPILEATVLGQRPPTYCHDPVLLPLCVQYWEPPEAAHLNLDTLACELCGSGEDDAHLLICDGKEC